MDPIPLEEIFNSVVRVPVAGPSPNNTLVFVRGRLTALEPDYTSGDGFARVRAIGMSAYRIVGFDPTRALDYHQNTRWSVTGFLAHLSTEDDQSFTLALDAIQGHLTDDGRFYVTANLAGALEDGALTLGVNWCAYILVQEPQPDFTRPPRRPYRIQDGIRLNPPIRIRERLRIPAAPRHVETRRVIDHDCP